jgi:chorismate dehydratase
MLHGPQRGRYALEFELPAECARRMAGGQAEIGIIPSFELIRQDLRILLGAGIACHAAVRSILLISKCPAEQIRSVALDTSSRTSVQLVRVILEHRFGVRFEPLPHPPDLAAMLQIADAGLIIGDPALHADPSALPYYSYDLGEEWVNMTGLPMVFAVWAGRAEAVTEEVEEDFRASCRWGRERIEEIAGRESAPRGFTTEQARNYLTHNIVNELGPREYAGLARFLELAGGEAAAQRVQQVLALAG